MQSSPRFEFRTLGRLSIREIGSGSEADSVLAQSKRLALLLYLALARPRGPQPRDVLLALFWPDLDQDRARGALNQAVYVLRRTLGRDAVQTASDGSLSVGPCFRIDVWEMEQALDEDRPGEAAALYSGELAPGLYVDAGAAFEQWLDKERDRIRRLAVSAAIAHSHHLLEAGDGEDAAQLLGRAREWAPLDEEVVAALVTALVATGDRSRAARVVQAHEQALARELDIEVEPNAALRGLVEEAPSRPADELRPPDGAPGGTVSTTDPLPASEGTRRAVRRPFVHALLATVPVAAAAFLLLGPRSSPGPAGGSAGAIGAPRVLVLPFDTPTEDERLGRIAQDWLVQGLSETGLVQVVRPLERRDGPTSVAEVRAEAERVGATHVLLGSLVGRRDSLAFRAQLYRSDGRFLRGTVARGSDTRPLAGIERLRQRTLGMMAVVLDPGLRRWASTTSRTPTYRAYRAYATALETYPGHAGEYSSPDYEKAAEAFEAVAEIDLDFTAPLIWAMRAWEAAERIDELERVVGRLAPRRTELPPWEKAMLDVFTGRLRGDREAVVEAARRAVRFSSDPETLMSLADAYHAKGDFAGALDVLTAAEDTAWLRGSPGYWELLTDSRHMLGDFRAELRDARRWPATPSEGPYRALVTVRALAALDRPQEARREAEQALVRWRLHPTRVLHVLPNLLLWHGHPREAKALARRVLTWHEQRPPALRDWTYAHFHALVLQRLGRYAEATAVLSPVVEEHPTAWNVGQLGVIAAASGDRERALEMLTRLEVMSREDRRIVPWPASVAALGWRGTVLAHLGDVEAGLGLLQEALRRGLPRGAYLHGRMELQVFWSAPGFEALMEPSRQRPHGGGEG